MTRTVHGVMHGKTIQLDEDLGIADGQEVEVQVKMKVGARTRKELPGPPPGWQPGGKKTLGGALADLCTAEEDRLLEEIQQDRRRERRQEIAE